ncbi:type II toxin-antitoxin system RelE/ParE family toxin [Massilia sp. R2A-15]|uniref:type II toxin-antitoxin system RelE/ParE family toxin n=1 Tax=Massilia sp. R2A-15 TaxID=3064278 RepID=UPI00273654AA|nr:type II toxin-antitoxin system RelE/ParE family toxin [Massilia sp. R2A-15]WLI89115.1 type II toxin-antitoxin system RelE/ParE family toxin [Massilia sp. R2A-15]
MAEYRLAPKAERDLEDIWSYSYDNWGEQQANDYTDGLVETFDALAMSPASAPACDDIKPGYRRQVFERHVIYFRITGYGIEIIRVLHGRMHAANHLKP